MPNSHPACSLLSMLDNLSADDLSIQSNYLYHCHAIVMFFYVKLHFAHTSMQHMYHMACEVYFWPSMKNDIRHIVEGCEECQCQRPSQPHDNLIHR